MNHKNYSATKDLARELLLKGECGPALDKYRLCEELLRSSPESDSKRERAVLSVNSAICLQKLKKYSEALALAEKALEQDSSYSKAYYRKALIQKERGELAEAFTTASHLFKIEQNSDTRALLAEITQLIKKEQEDCSWEYIFQKSGLLSGWTPERIKRGLAMCSLKFDPLSKRRDILNNSDFLKTTLEFSQAQLPNSSNEQQLLMLEFCLQATIILLKDADNLMKYEVFLNEHVVDSLITLLKSTAKSWLDTPPVLGNISTLLPYMDFNSRPGEIMRLLFFLLENASSRNLLLDKSDYGLRNFLLHNLQTAKPESAHKDATVSLLQQLWDDIEKTCFELVEQSREAQHIHEALTLIYRYLRLFQEKIEDLDSSSPRAQSLRYCLSVYIGLSLEGSESFKTIERPKLYANLLEFFIRGHASSEAIKFYCLESLAIMARDQEILKEISVIPEATEKVKELRGLFSGLNKAGDSYTRIKIALLLIKLNSKEKEKDIKLFSELFDFSYIEAALKVENPVSDSDSVSLVELLSHLTCFDSFKVALIKRKSVLERLQVKLEPWITMLLQHTEGADHKSNRDSRQLRASWEYQVLNAYLNITLNLTLDQIKEYLEKQRKKFGVSDEELENLKIMHRKYAGEDIPDDSAKYNEAFIRQNDVRGFFCRSLKVKNIVASFLRRFGAELSEFSSLVIVKLLATLSQEKENRPAMFDTQILRWVSSLALTAKAPTETKTYCHQFISSQLASCNPRLFDYALSVNLTDALILTLQESEHELVTFEALLSLVQLSTLGDHITIRLKEKFALNAVINQLLEPNEFIIHGALELVNNILCLDNTFVQDMSQAKYPVLYKCLGAFLEKYEEILSESAPQIGSQSFDDPVKIYSTLLSLFAIMSYDEGQHAFLRSIKLFSSAGTEGDKRLGLLDRLLTKHLSVTTLDIYGRLFHVWKNDPAKPLSQFKNIIIASLERSKTSARPINNSLSVKIDELMKSIKSEA